MNSLELSTINQIVSKELNQPNFNVERLYDELNDDYYYQIVSKVKENIVKMTYNEEYTKNSHFELKNKTTITFDLTPSSINKILRNIIRKETKGFYFDQSITGLIIYINNPNFPNMLLFSFLFLYLLKYIPIKKVHVSSPMKHNDINLIISLYLQMANSLNSLIIKPSMIDLYAILDKSTSLQKIKLYNIAVDVALFSHVIQNLTNLKSLSFFEVDFIGDESSFDTFSSLLSQLSLIKFKVKSLSKYLPAKVFLSPNQFISLLQLTTIKYFVVEDMLNRISDINVNQLINTSFSEDKDNDYISILVQFNMFSHFKLFHLTDFLKVDIGMLDQTSYINLTDNLIERRRIKDLTLRFQKNILLNMEEILKRLENERMFYQKNVSFYNIVLFDIKSFIVNTLLNNRIIQKFVICPSQSINNNNTTKTKIDLSQTFKKNEIPFYLEFKIDNYISYFYALKKNHYTKDKIYKCKRIKLIIGQYLAIKKEKGIYCENNGFIYFNNYNL